MRETPARNFALGMLLAFALTACAGFQYRYYTLDIPKYDGMLLGKLGKTGWPDLPFEACHPSTSNKAPCVVVTIDEYETMLKELESLRIALKDCQKGK